MDKVEIKEYQNLSEPVRVTVVTGLLNMEGVRVPAGGKEGQNLTKKSDKDYDVYWADPDDINSIEHITLNGEEVPVENKTAKITVDKSTVGLENIYAQLNENIIKNPEKTYLVWKGNQFPNSEQSQFQARAGYTIDWGDGAVETFETESTAPNEHTYTDGYDYHLIAISGLTVIHYDAFRGCTGLTSIIIGSGVTTIQFCAFVGTSLTHITIPDSVTSIDWGLFAECAKLTHITIGNGLTSISRAMFQDCTSLTSITIPDNVTLIVSSAFDGCTSLTSITLPGVTVIGYSAFNGCTSLTDITIGSSVTTIGDHAFRGCSGLTSVTIKSATPPTLSSSAIPTTIEKIIVPKSAINAYKGAAGWSTYADKIVYEVDSSDLDKAITDLDVDNIAYKNKRNTFTQQMYIRNNNPYLTLGPNSQDEGNLGKDSLTFDYASGTKEVVTIYNRDYLYHHYYDSSTGEDIEARLGFPTKSGTLALIEDLTAKLDKPTVADSNYKIVTYNGTNSGTLDYSNAPNASSVMQRDADGRAQVVSGVSGNDIVNYSQLDTKYDKTGGTIGGNVVITGDLTVNGTQHINNTENLNVENAMIYSNANGATLATNGGIGIKKNATDVYGIVYDPTSDSVKLGIGKSDANGRFTFNANEGQPVAIRDDSSKFTNNNLVKWDSTNHKLVDAGKNVENLVDKLPASLRSQAYVRNANGEDSGLAYTYTDEGDTLAVRNASGQLQVSTPSQDLDAANKKFVIDEIANSQDVITDTEIDALFA